MEIFDAQVENALCGFKIVLWIHETQKNVPFDFSHHMEGFRQLKQSLLFSSDHVKLSFTLTACLFILISENSLLLWLPPIYAWSVHSRQFLELQREDLLFFLDLFRDIFVDESLEEGHALISSLHFLVELYLCELQLDERDLLKLISRGVLCSVFVDRLFYYSNYYLEGRGVVLAHFHSAFLNNNVEQFDSFWI